MVTLFSRRLFWALALPSINTQSMVWGGTKRVSEEVLDRGGGGGGRKEGLTQSHSANRVTHPKSGCGSDWITNNNPWRHRPQVNTSRAISKEKPLKFFIDVQKGSRGRSQVPSWNKNITRARIVFSKPRS